MRSGVAGTILGRTTCVSIATGCCALSEPASRAQASRAAQLGGRYGARRRVARARETGIGIIGMRRASDESEHDACHPASA
jgi:hypothetical protein